MRILGIILIVLGAIGLIWGGITYTRHRDTVTMGPMSVTVQQRDTLPISPLLSGAALIAGIALVVVGAKRTRQ
jgi:hypothetical protein